MDSLVTTPLLHVPSMMAVAVALRAGMLRFAQHDDYLIMRGYRLGTVDGRQFRRQCQHKLQVGRYGHEGPNIAVSGTSPLIPE